MPSDPHIVKLGTHRKQEVALLVGDMALRIDQTYRLLVRDTGHGTLAFRQVLPRSHVHNMHTTERMHYIRVQLQVASFIDLNLQSKLLLEFLLELLLKSEYRLDFSQVFGRRLGPLTAVDGEGEAITHRVLRAYRCQLHIRLIFYSNRSEFP